MILANVECSFTRSVFHVDIDVFFKNHFEDFLVDEFSCSVQRRTPTSDKIEVYGILFEELFNIMRVFEIDRKLNRQPSIARALIHIDLHFNKLIKDLSGLTKYRIVQSAPSLFSKLINNVRFFLLNFEQNFFFDILRIVLENIKKSLQMFMLDFF